MDLIASSDQPEMVAPVLASYSDYRQYLRDFYAYKQALHRHDLRPYSYAMFAASADIKSPHYLKLIIDGERNLSTAMARSFAKALQLNREQSEEFQLLVQYNQELEPVRRNQYLKQLSDLRIQTQVNHGQIDPSVEAKVPNWLTWVVRSLLDQEGVELSSKGLQAALLTKVTTSAIEASIVRLLETGELQRNLETGELERAQKPHDVPSDIPVALIRKLQADLLYLSLESLFRDATLEREFGSLTLALNEDEFEQIKFELRQMRKRLNRDIAARREKGKAQRVYQLNIQFFPVSGSTAAKKRV